MKTYKIKTKYIDCNCTLKFGEYGNSQKAIRLLDAETGELIANATTNIEAITSFPWSDPEYSNTTIIKNYSENEGMLEALIKAGIVSEPVEIIDSQFVSFPRVEIL